MQPVPDGPPCDTCDTMIANDKAAAVAPARRRFLDAYRQRPNIAPAARLAGVHRATVYRWKADPAFVAAMREAIEGFFADHRANLVAEDAARQKWRAERERARKPMRRYYLSLARGELPAGDWSPPSDRADRALLK